MRVLVVEDNAVDRKVVTAIVRRLGHEATAVGSGAEAVAAFQECAFDCVLLDLQMPEMDGVATAQALRGQRTAERVPILAVTALDLSPSDRDLCLSVGIDDFLQKPVTPDTLGAALRRLLGRAAC